MQKLTSTLQNPELIRTLQKKLPPLVSFALVIVLSYQLAKLSWQLIEPSPGLPPAVSLSSQPASAIPSSQQQQQKLMQLQQAHLFGQANAPIKKSATTTAPETRLNLVLKGVLAATPMKLATAIISQGKSGKEESYGLGDTVPGNAIIDQIHPTHVLLMRNGQLETLKLPEQSVGGTETTSPDNNTLNLHQTQDKVLGDIRRDILKNPTSFGEYAIPIPVSKNGKLLGYRLRPQKKGIELFKQFGLDRNDIVTKVNGVDLNNPAQAISALRKLSDTSNIDLVVLRNGVETPLQFSIR